MSVELEITMYLDQNKEYEHHLLKSNEQNDLPDTSTGTFSIAEKIVVAASIFSILIAIGCCIWFMGLTDDSSPMTGFAIIPLGIVYFVGLIFSVILHIMTKENEYKTKTITTINLIVYLCSLLVLLIWNKEITQPNN